MVERIPITEVSPVVERGRYPTKAAVGESFTVAATVFREGHEALGCGIVLSGPDGQDRGLVRMAATDEPDRYTATVTPTVQGAWTYRVVSWSDPYASWRHAAEIKIPAEIDVELMLLEGVLILKRAGVAVATEQAGSPARDVLLSAATAANDTTRPVPVRLAALTSRDVAAALTAFPLRDLVSTTEPFPLQVDRERALYGSWYELFPRSEGASYDAATKTWTSGTFTTAAARLPAVAEMGFDVVYLPPIHPIGEANRKGRNNTLTPGPADPGSTWAIGSKEGGHDAVHPDLGTVEDFDAFVVAAESLGLEVALDLALQCAPDHPWVTSHPEWFTTRADGSVAYAENPPKKYQDIYPLNFDNDYDGLAHEVLRVVRHWMAHGVRIFRVDNPHTKPVTFWEWLLGEVRSTDPDVIFLSEAFTRPAMMRALAMVGFHQSYTYFTWRNSKWELESYLDELSHQTSDVMRPNLFVNTPDILSEYLQYGGPAAFRTRATIAAMGAPTWGVYAGFEIYEHVAVKPGSEEYLDSEKFQYRPRDWKAAAAEERTLAPHLTKLNEIRRRHPALQRLSNVTIHSTDDDAIICFSKRERDDIVIVVVNVDPHAARETTVHLDMPALGMDWHDTFGVDDELTGEHWRWAERNYVRLDPASETAHVLSIRKA
ncbi:MAG: alpha-1,4-glucan--maltose-1-phosphate maltosyltransferase [Propionibacteriales bacterium]|nr:alpha-1,4-glucan--maltose-1-phosphate maltosyltransferase [Propionibacteriales bacterium]